MHYYLITPHAPLVLRSGKPVDANTGDDTVALPLPSTLAGALRTASADHQQLDFGKERAKIESWICTGALLAVIDEHDPIMPLFPKPQDVYYTGSNGKLLIHPLKPESLKSGEEGCDLPEGLLPLFIEGNIKEKPVTGPAWWDLEAMIAWLGNDKTTQKATGYDALPKEMRVHIALDWEVLSTKTDALYRTSGSDFQSQRKPSKWSFDFAQGSCNQVGRQSLADSEMSGKDSRPTSDEKRGWQSYRFGLIAGCDQKIPNTLLRLGGEGRLSALERKENVWPTFPDALKKQIAMTQQIRLLLVTPALFNQGWRPGWLDGNLKGEHPTIPGLKLKLCAAAIDRWQPISGWDIQKRKPKAVRRLVPAGSVYWFKIENTPKGDWLQKLWLTSISDDPRDQKSGFGLVLPGLWT